MIRRAKNLTMLGLLALCSVGLANELLVPGEYDTIQAAIDAADDYDMVLVADGNYTGDGNRDIDFLGKPITVRSESGPESCIIDCETLGRGFNFDDGEDANSVLDGFTITNGDEISSGGIFCTGSSPTITNCTIKGNRSGIYCRDSNPTITNCTISENGIGYRGGGGIFCQESSPTITNCTIRGNNAWLRPPGGGGGIYCYNNSSPTITNCTITGNWGGITCGHNSSPIIKNCTISGNRDEGIYCRDSSLTIINCILWGNTREIVDYGASISVTYTDIQGGWEGEGNIDEDPLLTLDGHLQADSPCIDAGDPNADFTSQVDIDGEPRIMGTRVDMGSDEFLDSDTDALPDWWESKYFDSATVAEPNTDSDLDGYANLTEYLYSSDPTVGATAYYVDANQPDDSGDGLSWETAKSTIQAAINATKNCGDQVIIAPGIYTGLGNYNLDPGGRMIVIQSTDPNDPEVVATTIIDPDRRGRGFYFHSSETTRCVVSGLTITNGRAPWEDIGTHSISRGGAILCSASSPTIINCTITGNSGAGHDRGGGICCTDNSSPTIDNCTITKNTARFGSGIYCDAGSSPIITNCTITGNKGPMCYCICSSGGGIYCRDSNPLITNCTISGNYPGGICCVNSSPAITNCTVSGHVVGHGNSGISCEDNSSPTITNCFISENHHGIYCDHSSPTITNCTISSNSGRYGGGIYCYKSSSTIANCILWGNTDSGIEDESAQIRGGTPIINYSCVQGWTGALGGIGNIGADPCFIEPGYWDVNYMPDDNIWDYFWVEGDYHLLRSSPCIDAASDANIYTDIEGNIRPFDFPGVDNNGELPEFDMGAYELVPVEAAMKLTPQTLNCNSRGNLVKAHFVLPEGFLPEDVNVNKPAWAEPMGIESEYIKVLSSDKSLVKLEITFDRETFCAQITETGEVEITVIGSLTTSRYFYATNTIKIKPRR